jgi:sialidase-1
MSPSLQQLNLFVKGQDGYHTFRIPSAIVTPRGTVLAFCEGRKHGHDDSGDIDLVLKRSFDGGATWQPLQVVADEGSNTIGNPCPVVDHEAGEIWLPLTRNLGTDSERQIMDGTSSGSREVWITKSTDDGSTWSEPVEITSATKEPDWTWYATGPGVGIQLGSGRLLVPCDHAVAGSGVRRSHVIYSDDHGVSWKLGGVVGDHTNECQAVELKDGTVLINMRSYHGQNCRAIATSRDGGLTWSDVTLDPTLIEPVCQASLIRLISRDDTDQLLFSNPASTRRERMTVRVSDDGGKSWPVARLLHAGPSAYSCLTVLPNGTITCLYEQGIEHPYERVVFARFSLEWLRAAK